MAPLEDYRRKRDFSRTEEPEGGVRVGRAEGLEFVVQKHEASHLHFDLRLEMGGVMRSWAVPKGPSLDPEVKRLAMEVEDHPIEYNDFEGAIPAGEYGGGTVMLWDRGTYVPEEVRPGENPDTAAKRGYHKGKLSFALEGERLRGSFTLVRTDGGEKPKWLLIKHDDEHADASSDVTVAVNKSVTTGRTMEEIAEGKGGSRTWRSNGSTRPRSTRKSSRRSAPAGGDFPHPPPTETLLPMLATTGDRRPEGDGWTYEPKYDGIRALAFVSLEGAALVTRNGNDKTRQFPEVVEALRGLAREIGQPVVLDGELVGLRQGKVVRFESLQGRMHLTDATRIRRLADSEPAALIAFDVLLSGERVLLHEPWTHRRAVLEELLLGRTGEQLRLGESSADGEEMYQRASRAGWEGIVAKRTDAAYRPGKRSSTWIKLKIENRQELVIGGWTEGRKTRGALGAILLGYYDQDGNFMYAGHTGTGFTREGLREMHTRLRKLERKTSPFHGSPPKTNEKPHWVTPKIVAEIKFNEWSSAGKLRQPVFMGVRDDKDPKSVIREPGNPGKEPAREKREGTDTTQGRVGPPARDPAGNRVVQQIRQLQRSKPGGGTLDLEGGERLPVTNLRKVFFPAAKLTKGDLLAYYATMAEFILPRMQDRPLVLKRYPNGIEGKSFYQQSAPDDVAPGVRVETVIFGEDQKEHARLVGGNLATLLYTIQSGAISYDPWHSRIGHLESADYTIIDLDPGPGVLFRTVVQVARWVKEEMDALGLHGALKTSGSRGLHIYLPLPEGTPLEAATLVAQIVATRVARRHPKEATVERMTKKRPEGTIYLDYLQNILGKTVAGVYAARARAEASVSTPLAWDELTDDLDPRDFTILDVPARVATLGDLWAEAMGAPIDLETLLQASAA